MTQLHIVVDQVGGFAREDASTPCVIGAYTNPKVAQQVKIIANSGASIHTVEINHVPEGYLRSAEQMGFGLRQPTKWVDIHNKVYAYYLDLVNDHRHQLVNSLGVDLYNRMRVVCKAGAKSFREDASNRQIGFIQGLLAAAGVIRVDEDQERVEAQFEPVYTTA